MELAPTAREDSFAGGDLPAAPPNKPDNTADEPGEELPMTYPTTALKRNLDMKWKRMVCDAAIEAEASGDKLYLATIVRKVWPESREFTPEAYYHLKGHKEKEEYQTDKKLFDSRKKTIRKWMLNRLEGHYDDLRADRARTSTKGRNSKHFELKELLCEYFVQTAKVLGGRVGANLMRSKAIAMVRANAEDFKEEGCVATDGAVKLGWLSHFLRRFYEEYGIALRKKNKTLKCSRSEVEKRLGAYWRNVIRVRAHFAPGKIQFGAYDHTPFYRRENQGKMLAPKGADQVTAKEDNAGAKSRFTVVLFASSDGVPRAPEVMMKGVGPERMTDLATHRIPSNITFRVSPSASYDSASTMDMVQEKYGQWAMDQLVGGSGCGYRVLVIDQFAGQLTPEALAKMIKLKRIPIIIWGHLTPLLQVADRYQNRIFKSKYLDEEAIKVASILEKCPGGIPKLTREETLYLVSKVQRDMLASDGYFENTRREFARTGTTIALDGSEDDLVATELQTYWHTEGICEVGGKTRDTAAVAHLVLEWARKWYDPKTRMYSRPYRHSGEPAHG